MQREHSPLFREFADLDQSNRTEILAFASKYGPLGVSTQNQATTFLGDDGELHDHHASGEPHLLWALEICFMREALRLADRKKSTSTTKRLKWLFDRNLQHVQGRLFFTPAGEPRLVLEPVTLIVAMWLQWLWR